MGGSRRRTLFAIAAVGALLAGCDASGSTQPPSTGGSSPSSGRTSAHSRPPSPSASPSSKATRAAALDELKDAVAARSTGSVSVAAVDLTTGRSVSAGSTGGQWMASTYKLFLTEALLATHDGVNDEDAEAAIEHSDNAAGYRLFEALGSTSGTLAAFRRFGLTHTTMPSNAYDPTFATTSATDWIRILRNLVGPGQLTASQRSYVTGLLANVQADQRWGVGAVATGTFLNKNGWETVDSGNPYPEPSDGGRWITNSVGIADVHGQKLLMAVLTQHNDSFDDGKALVKRLAKLVAAAVTS